MKKLEVSDILQVVNSLKLTAFEAVYLVLCICIIIAYLCYLYYVITEQRED